MEQIKAENAAIKILILMEDLDFDEKLEAMYIVRLNIIRKMGGKQ